INAGGDDAITFQANPTDLDSGDLDATAGSIIFNANVTTTGDADVTALTGGISDDADNGTANLTADEILLTLSTGGATIGASAADRFELDANVLQVTASGSDAFLYDETGGVALRDSSVGGGGEYNLLADGGGDISSETIDGMRDVGAGVLVLETNGGGSIGTGVGDRLEINAVTRLDATTAGGDVFVLDPNTGLPVGTISATGATVDLLSTDGPLTDANGGSVNVTAADLVAEADGGINLDTDVDTITAVTTAAGSILLDEASGVELTNIDSFDGAVTITAGGTVDAVSVTAGGAGDVSLTTTAGGDINATSIMAVDDRVTLDAAGSILHVGTIVTPISVDNFSFEDPALADGGFTSGSSGTTAIPDWEITTGGSSAGVFNATATQYPIMQATDGDQVAFSNGRTFRQVLADTLAANTTYELLVDIGDRADTASPGYSVGLYAGGVLLAEVDQTDFPTANGGFVTATVNFATGGAPAQLGLPLEIRLFSGGVQTNFDNVRLTASVAAVNVTADEAVLTAGANIGAPGDPLITAVANLEAEAVTDIYLVNQGELIIGGITALEGVSAGGVIDVTASSPLDVTEDVISTGGPVTLTAADGAAGGDNLTVRTTITVQSDTGDVNLRAGDNLTLEDSSTVSAAAGQVNLWGDFGNADPGLGSVISLLGTITSGTQATATGDADGDTILVNPGLTHTIDSILLDGADGDDTYLIQLGRLDGGANAVDIADSGAGDNDEATVTATDADEEITVNNNVANGLPQTGGFVDNTTIGETVTYTETLENLTVAGGPGQDIFHVQPSQTAEITIDGDDPVFGLGAGDVPLVGVGDTLDFDPLDNTFILNGKAILTDGGAPSGFLPVNFRSIEHMPFDPLGTDTLRFDMDSTPVVTATDFTSVPGTQLYGAGTPGSDFGWDTTLPQNSATVLADPLLKDYHFDTAARTFQADVADGWYLVSVTMGNGTGQVFENLQVTAEGQLVLPDIDIPALQFVERSFVVQVQDSVLDVTFSDADVVNPVWLVNALEIRPAILLTLGVVDPGPLLADGVTVDVFQGVNATPNALVTVSTDFGTITSADASSLYAGIQVLADGDGEYTFEVLRPNTAGEALIQVEETTGAQTGCLIVEYTTVETHFDFNTSGSPTASGYVGIGVDNDFDAMLGYGWVTTADTNGAAGPTDLLRDGHFGTTDNTFQVNLDNGVYTVNVTLGSPTQALTSVDVLIEGVLEIDNLSTAAGQFVHRSFEVTIADGVLDLGLLNDGGNLWAIAALDIVVAPAVITLTGPGSVTADGVTVDMVTGAGATPGGLITVTTDLGVITTADADPFYAGVQVVADGLGDFTFDIQRPNLGGTANVTAVEVNAASAGATTIEYTAPAALRFDLNSSGTPTAAGFIGLGTANLFDAGLGYGWMATAPTFSTAGPNDLLRDLHYGSTTNTFLVDLDNGDYVVNLTMGTLMAFDQVDVYAEGMLELSGLGSAANQFLQRSFTTTVADGQLTLQLTDTGGSSFFPVNAIEILPVPVDVITIAGPTMEDADGSTIDAYTGSGAEAGSLVTVRSDLGVITTADADPFYAGVQVVADGLGGFMFDVQRPGTAGLSTITAEQVSAASAGSLAVTYTAPPTSLLFDLNTGTNITEAGYTGVGTSNLFDGVRGWTSTAPTLGLAGPDALHRDFHYGVSDNTFQAAVTAGGTFDVTLRFFYIVGSGGFDVWSEGILQLDEVTIPASTMVTETFTVTDNGDGVLDIAFLRDGASYFLVNAIEIAQVAPLLSADAPVTPLADMALLTEADLAPVVAEAIARWTSVDADAAEKLANVEVRVDDLSGGYLGLASSSSSVIRIDADAAGHGWFVDATPWDDVEFDAAGAALTADATGRFDLLTVVMHELGHLLGLEDHDAEHVHGDALMSETLPLSTRRAHAAAPLTEAAVDAAFDAAFDRDETHDDSAAFEDEAYWAFLHHQPAHKQRQQHDDYFATLDREA
ncbi:MAG: hypothetical protein RIC55_01635, partial [Pirellulaceae bacterium]